MPALRRRSAAVAVLVLALGTAACSDDDGDTDDLAAATTTTAAETDADDATTTTGRRDATTTTGRAAGGTTPTEPPTTLADSDDTGKSELEDGRHFGYWKTFEIGDTIAYGEFDLAYFLSGDAAAKAAKEHGDQSPPPNDYYIVNDNPKLRTLIAEGDTKVMVLGGDGTKLTASNVADFAVDRNQTSGYWVTIVKGIVTEIEEQYQP